MDTTNANVILTEMERLGTEQARKTYSRHGVGENQFGVSYADMGKFQKKLKINHDIALDLWESGIHDAQILALMVADPQKADSAKLDQWVQSLTNYVLSDALGTYVAKTPLAQQKAEAWIPSNKEWISHTGWNVLADIANSSTTLPDSYFEHWLEVVERDIDHAPNRTRHAMNTALIALGARNSYLQSLAVAAAGRIGKVKVDHGLTNCKTPDAVSYIQKTVDHRMAKAAKAKVKA